MIAQPIYFAFLQVGQLSSDQPHAATSAFSRVLIIAGVVLLAFCAAVAVYLIWRFAAGKPRDESHAGGTRKA